MQSGFAMRIQLKVAFFAHNEQLCGVGLECGFVVAAGSMKPTYLDMIIAQTWKRIFQLVLQANKLAIFIVLISIVFIFYKATHFPSLVLFSWQMWTCISFQREKYTIEDINWLLFSGQSL